MLKTAAWFRLFIVRSPMRLTQSSDIAAIEAAEYSLCMNETFPERLVELQKDPDYFTRQKLEELKVVFDRVCSQLEIDDIYKDARQRDKLAIVILVRAKAYQSEGEMVEAAIVAMQVHTV